MTARGFSEDIASMRRTVLAADPANRLAVFGALARELVNYADGGMPKPDVVDALRETALTFGGIDETDIEAKIGDAFANPFKAAKPNAANSLSSGNWRSLCSTAAALQTMTFPPVSYVVPGLIPEGLTLLAGKPKIGKSWLGLDIALAVAGARYCLGERKPDQGDVLYAALEDNPRRLQRRIDKLLKTFGEAWPDRLTWATAWRRLDKGGVEDIGEWIDGAEKPRLVILDTLAGVRPIKTAQGYTEDYESLAALHRLANDKGIAILVLHHTRKMEADDPIDTVSGTLGLTGCADTILVLARSSKGTTLYLRGRDIEEAEHAVQFAKDACKWTILGEAADVHRSDERKRVLSALKAGDMPLPDLIDATGMKSANLRKLLHFMVGDGEVIRPERGVYALPPVTSVTQ